MKAGRFRTADGTGTSGRKRMRKQGTERQTDRKKPCCNVQTDMLYYKSCRREAAGSLFEN
ncbi:MAG: hypothetical protein BAA02_03335 [Paenibacillaceae bacterium ZCTH02-B3]|nr:MAG: hypothetical protein BAA02_03335 [Paenibacillaceae bacterium ZCTH02-B3]